MQIVVALLAAGGVGSQVVQWLRSRSERAAVSQEKDRHALYTIMQSQILELQRRLSEQEQKIAALEARVDAERSAKHEAQTELAAERLKRHQLEREVQELREENAALKGRLERE
jgi:uncharacterized protein YceH (UPF0502 family)